MNFKHCPSFIYADVALLSLQEDGNWAGVDADGVNVRFSEARMRASTPVATDGNGDGLYAVVDDLRAGESFRFVIDRATDLVHVENSERPIPYETFVRCAMRADDDGKPICSFLIPLHEQYSLCRERPGGDKHCMAIADEAEALRATNKVGDLINVGLYDAVSSGITDGLSFVELMQKVTAKGGRPVHEKYGLDEALPGQWAEIRAFPQYMMGPIRALFGSYMDERIGDFPLERISRLHAPRGAPIAMYLDEVAELVSVDEPFDGGNVIRNYRTSEVAHYRGNGYDAIVFSDMAGTYAYAWPTPEAPKAAPAPGKGI